MDKKLLVIGAGGHGQVVAEIALDCGYSFVSFVDDNSKLAIGNISNLESLKDGYSDAFVGIGNNQLRESLLNKLKLMGFTIPTLIHPTAYISRSCKIGEGSVIEPYAIVNAHSIVGRGCIVSVGAIIDHNATIGDFCHINAGSIVKAGAIIKAYEKLEAGKVVLGYEAARVKEK